MSPRALWIVEWKVRGKWVSNGRIHYTKRECHHLLRILKESGDACRVLEYRRLAVRRRGER